VATASGNLPVSVLDWAPIRSGETPADALRQAADFALHVESLGFERFWITEHHSTALAASAATSIVIGHIASKTSTIRVGSGGIMLPIHPPLIVAEQFGTLGSLYPGRIDLGLGRSTGTLPGSDAVIQALHLSPEARERFMSDVVELQSYFDTPQQDRKVIAEPGAGIDVPIWLLGSSDFSATQAAALGLPFAFATQIGYGALDDAVNAYRSNFKPSGSRSRPYLLISAMVVAAETDEVAQHLFTSIQQAVVSKFLDGKDGRLPPPVHGFIASITSEARSLLERLMPFTIVGSRETVSRAVESLIGKTKADELMVTSFIYDQDARRRSHEIIAEICHGHSRSKARVA
jgi:luciferase family oxidoreductase group 1